jgi:hypothetical protein
MGTKSEDRKGRDQSLERGGLGIWGVTTRFVRKDLVKKMILTNQS